MEVSLPILSGVCIGLALLFLAFGIRNAYFKIGYYERMLKNHKDSFSPELWEKIETVMKMRL